MASPTKKITEDQIRKLVCENKNSLNPLNMEFTYEYARNLLPLNWIDMRYAIRNKFLAHQTAIDHAIDEIQKSDCSTKEVIELACILQSEAKFPYDINRLVDILASSYTAYNEIDSRNKFLYLSLNWVYEHKEDYCNPIEVIDIICDEIDYPDEVKNLVSFVPASNSIEKEPFSRLALYLNNERKRWT
jgi:hypothetical protein